jgi:glycosyltransferase involved in cell wall biosynthesis
LFTTFPVASETFLQREVRALHAQGREIAIHSIWGGKPQWEGLPVQCFPFACLLTLFFWIPYWAWRRPAALRATAEALFTRDVAGVINFGENLMGMGFALCMGRHFERTGTRHLHGVWATMPAAAAWLLHRLTGIGFSFGAHAYDLFEHGGDLLLREKTAAARFVRTSTAYARARVLRTGAGATPVICIRRGLNRLPELGPARRPRQPLRIVSVGRLVEKMGYFAQLRLYAGLARRGVDFSARIVGGGPLKWTLRAEVERLGLAGRVVILGTRGFKEVAGELAGADVFLFTGVVCRNGDRAGLPNAIAEAMAWGLPVVASPVGGVREAVADGVSGILAEGDAALDALIRLQHDDVLYEHLRAGARHWIEGQFLAGRNMEELWRWMTDVAPDQVAT